MARMAMLMDVSCLTTLALWLRQIVSICALWLGRMLPKPETTEAEVEETEWVESVIVYHRSSLVTTVGVKGIE